MKGRVDECMAWGALSGMTGLFLYADALGGGRAYGYTSGSVIEFVFGTLFVVAGTLLLHIAMDWVALLMQGDDPKSEGWEGLDTREAAAEYDLLTDSVECSIVADTEDVTEGDPLGLSFCGGYGARSFLLAVTEDVPEYAEQRLELIGE